MEKIRLGVVFGGASSEYEVSLLSSASVLSHINEENYDIHKIGITRDGRMFYYSGSVEKISDGTWTEADCVPCVISPDRSHHGLLLLEENVRVIPLDCVFPVLHGKNGEDGTIQGLFTMAGIPFVGCGTLASSACMDKAVTHTLLESAGINSAKWLWTTEHEFSQNEARILDRIDTELGYPCFVKPANAGSSVGITKVKERSQLKAAFELAFQNDSKVLVEEMVRGLELECAVLGNEDPIASCVGEIAPDAEFYDYNAKYIDGTTKTYAPARISDDYAEEIRRTAVKAYQTMGCTGLARVDFFLSLHNQKIIVNEINTIPGFTSISMYPQLFGVSGIPYPELIDRLVACAMNQTAQTV